MAKVKDKRYTALKHYINSGELKTWREIFDIVPRTQFSTDSGINYKRLIKKIEDPRKLTLKDIITLADLIEIDDRKLYELIRPTITNKRK